MATRKSCMQLITLDTPVNGVKITELTPKRQVDIYEEWMDPAKPGFIAFWSGEVENAQLQFHLEE